MIGARSLSSFRSDAISALKPIDKFEVDIINKPTPGSNVIGKNHSDIYLDMLLLTRVMLTPSRRAAGGRLSSILSS